MNNISLQFFTKKDEYISLKGHQIKANAQILAQCSKDKVANKSQ